MKKIEVSLLKQQYIHDIVAAFEAIGWQKPESQYKRYLNDQENNLCLVWVAYIERLFAGYVTLYWKSTCGSFKEHNIPEIRDLNILPDFRRRGIGSALLNQAETKAFQANNIIGIGVGLTSDYSDARRLYLTRGYIFDSNGLYYKGQQTTFGQAVTIDDDLCLMLTKSKP